MVCSKVLAPTITDRLCHEQLTVAAKDVDYCAYECAKACKEVCRDDMTLQAKLTTSNQDITSALKNLLKYVKEKHFDKILDIMAQINETANALVASKDSAEMIQLAQLLNLQITNFIKLF